MFLRNKQKVFCQTDVKILYRRKILLFIVYYLLFITLLVITFSNSLELKIITITHCVHIYNRFFVSLLLKHATDYVIQEIDARFYSDNNRTMIPHCYTELLFMLSA